MTSPYPIVPLRWYELWMLRFLARSPRIDRILVQQYCEDEDDPTLDYIPYLEELYQAPSADRHQP